MDSARARSHDGDIVCAAMFKHASIPIQAIPAAKNTAHNPSKIFTCPAANVIPANSRMANATIPSIESQHKERQVRHVHIRPVEALDTLEPSVLCVDCVVPATATETAPDVRQIFTSGPSHSGDDRREERRVEEEGRTHAAPEQDKKEK